MILSHEGELQGEPSYFTAWNLKANILYQQKELPARQRRLKRCFVRRRRPMH